MEQPTEPTALALDRSAVARGERYRTLHDMESLSRLVNSLLGALPDPEVDGPALPGLSPAVRRLHGVARPPAGADDAAAEAVDDARATYRARLSDRYGTA